MNPLVPVQGASVSPAALSDLSDLVQTYAVAPSTKQAYNSAWRVFTAWCDAQGVSALPATPETIAVFLSEESARRKRSTVEIRVAAVAWFHRGAGFDPPPTSSALVRMTLRALVRKYGRIVHKQPALSMAALTDALEALSLAGGTAAVRDRALLLLGFAGALRRGELVAIRIGDLSWRAEGLVLLLPQRKTDQEGSGTRLPIPYVSDSRFCAARAVRAWLGLLPDADPGRYLFRSVHRSGAIVGDGSAPLYACAVERAVKRACGDLYGAHSLRSGFATAAAAANVPERAIARQTGHVSLPVLRGYIQEGTSFINHPWARILGE